MTRLKRGTDGWNRSAGGSLGGGLVCISLCYLHSTTRPGPLAVLRFRWYIQRAGNRRAPPRAHGPASPDSRAAADCHGPVSTENLDPL